MAFWQFIVTWHDAVLAIANVAIAIGTLVLAIGIPYAIQDAGREQRDTFYATLDRTYFEIQKLLIEHPHLAQVDLTGKSPEEVVQYNAFAFIVWNFIESIYDYSKQERALAETWNCILHYEARAHGAWFLRQENRPKFKDSFVRYIKEGGFCAPVPHDS